MRALGELRILRSRELSFETIKQPVQDDPLAVVERDTLYAHPKTRFGENPAESGLPPSMARPKQPRNQSIQGVMSMLPFCVFSKMS